MSYVQEQHAPGKWSFIAAVLFPAVVIIVELVTGLCAEALFDPLPSIGHVLLVAAVPAINWLLWREQRRDTTGSLWLLVGGGAAIVVSAAYALLLLPILPFAAVAILLLGLGLLPFAPFASLFYAFRWTFSLMADRSGSWLYGLAGAAAGLLLLVFVDLPATATYFALNRYEGTPEQQRSAVALTREFGDTDMLLRLAHGDTNRATGLASFLLSSWSNGLSGSDQPRTTAARELYYRVTGTPFSAEASPTDGLGRSRDRRFQWDEDQGGESVGGRVEGLSLISSRLDGSIATADNLGYFEWTFDIGNAGPAQSEGRFTIALPEGAVASRATLWVNGEPREASVARRSAARAAYSAVVSAQRDPLLVTTDGAQRLLIQAFPILPGNSMMLRVGFTAPFDIAPDGRRRLALPAIVERNFAIAPDLRHAVWIESDGPIASPILGGDGVRILRAAIADETLLARRPRIAAPRITAPLERIGQVSGAPGLAPIAIAQRIAPADLAAPGALMLVVDGSTQNRAAASLLSGALDGLPRGLQVGLVIADGERSTVAPAPWSPAQRARFVEVIARSPFAGGEDNVPALIEAVETASAPGSAILWVHGPQPIVFERSRAQLDQWLERASQRPRLIRYQAVAGRALVQSGSRWFDSATEILPSGDPAADLRDAVRKAVGGQGWTVSRDEVPARRAQGSAHIVRLWAAGRIAADDGTKPADQDASIRLAHRLNLVTPLTGAVVLETDKDYGANGLPVPSADDVPTVPEPEVWALLAILVCAGLWLVQRRRVAVFG
ncbi:VIT domain-containing protein [Allosphingosinicella deserti]|uniref:VIT domain-containing protein n=1 Tax=Allosphingosinicella deserti TaxID=2116704 RepID=A0A2P7QZI0_9SPHN|nr:VIT domain-containing protein [Sphingomonas deserti]PSJ43370.1 hypothetical protein C7I55_03120 [Sphingomonas deserti]